MEAHGRTIRLAALGDSLTAGYGLAPGESFTAVLQNSLQSHGFDAHVLNFGISGDTTAGGLARVSQIIALKPDGVILELGANDDLSGLDPDDAFDNLSRIITQLGQADIPVLLVGMRVLAGSGHSYSDKFDAIFPRLAAEFHLPLYPYFLEGVAGDPALTLPDGLHPNAQGVREIVTRILPTVEHFVGALPPRP